MTFLDWLLSTGNYSLPKSEYLYGTTHLIVLAMVVVASIAMGIWMAKAKPKCRQIVLYVFAGILLFMECSGRVLTLVKMTDYNFWGLYKALIPMHFCSIVVWFFIVGVFAKSKVTLRLALIGGMMATVAYLAYPAVGLNMAFIGYGEFYSIFTHSIAFVAVVAALAMGAGQFKWKETWQPAIFFACIVVYAVLLNFVMFPGGDYMYITQNPLPFEFGPIPYQVVLALVIIGVVSLFYAFPSLKRSIERKKQKHKNLPPVEQKKEN